MFTGRFEPILRWLGRGEQCPAVGRAADEEERDVPAAAAAGAPGAGGGRINTSVGGWGCCTDTGCRRLSNAGHKNSETEEKTGENPGLNGHVSDSGTILNVLGQCDVRMLCAIKTCVLCVLCVLCVCCVNGRNTMV